MAGTYPAHQIDFAPGVASSAIPAGGDWVTITTKVFEWGAEWGSKDEFTQPGAGTGNLVLDNSGGLFDPDNSSGTYYGNLLPGMWFRILGGTTSANNDVFYGQVSEDGFQVAASQYADSVVHVRLLDAADFLATVELPGSVYEVEILADTPALWWRFGEADGTQATDSSGNGRHGTYAGGATENSTDPLVDHDGDKAIAFDGVDDAVTLASFTPGNAWSIEFWIQADPQAGEPAVVYLLSASGAFVGDIAIYETAASDPKLRYAYTNPATGSRTEYVSTADVFDGYRHHVVITQSGSTTNLYVDGAEGKTLASGAAANITWGPMQLAVGTDDFSPLTRHVGGIGSFIAATIDEFAIYTTALATLDVITHFVEGDNAWGEELSSTQIGQILDLVDYPSGQRNINTGKSRMQFAALGSDAWSALLGIAKAENGSIYVDHQDAGKMRFIDRQHRWTNATSVTSQATIGDGGGTEIPAESIDLADDRIINHASIQRANGATVIVEDTASQTTYRKRSISETGLMYARDSESQYRGERWVAEKKSRHRRVRSITLAPRKSTHPAWAHVFARKLNERITVKWRPTYGGTRSYEVWIIGITQRWSARTGLRTTFWLAPVPFDTTVEPYWIAGTSTAGVSTRPGY